MQKIELGTQPLDIGAAAAFLQVPEAGGVALFVGTTRRWTGERETARLEYECYEPMARKEMEALAGEAGRRWPVQRVVLLHRLGVVPLAEASVVVGVSTPHRADAFEACRFLIDRLKQRVPIWKREVYADGTTAWVEGERGEKEGGG
jgi:molybdopterin synthase catalytic subunit